MNYDGARELKDGGFKWSRENGGEVFTIAPCRWHTGDESDPLWYLRPYRAEDWAECEPHATREEAERHFYDYSLGQVKEQAVSWTSCSVSGCPAPASRALGTQGLSLYFSLTPLCDQHLSADTLVALYPFEPGLQLVHS